MRFALMTVLLMFGALGCSSEGGIEGQLLFQGRPLAEAQLEVYLQSGNQRTSTPFSVTSTDLAGRYRLQLPAGHYYLVARKKLQDSGQNRMLMAAAPENPYQVTDRFLRLPPFSLQAMGLASGSAAASDSWLSGCLSAAGEALADAYVYVYPQAQEELIGPNYVALAQSGTKGCFRLELPAGRYWLVARKRASGLRSGTIQIGDWRGAYPANPVTVAVGAELQLTDFPLSPVSAEQYRQRMATGKFVATETVISGRAVDAQGEPLAGIYVYAYRDSRMIGKPEHISAPTGLDGSFQLFVSSGGRYFIGARSTFGGPLEPGEWVGTYDAQPDHQLSLKAGRSRSIGDLQLREVW